MYLLAIVERDGKKIARLVHVNDFNKAVFQLNSMLEKGEVKEFKLPEELPDVFQRMMSNPKGDAIEVGG
jgi:hypothetical protein